MPEITRSVAVVVNPSAGRGKGGRIAPLLARRLHERGVAATLLIGTTPGEAATMAAKAVAAGTSALIACGGDGTVNLVLQAVVGTDTPLGLVPTGTGDDIARSLGIPRGDVDAACDIIAAGHTEPVDAAIARTSEGVQRWFIGVLSSGFDSAVNERANRLAWPRGKARYLVAIAAELRTFRPIGYRVLLDGVEHEGSGMLVAVGNGVSYGGGMQVCPGALVDDGLLSVTWLHELPTRTFLRVFPQVFSGKHIAHPSVAQHTAQTVRIEASGQVAYADGEPFGLLPVDVEIHPGVVRVLRPARAT